MQQSLHASQSELEYGSRAIRAAGIGCAVEVSSRIHDQRSFRRGSIMRSAREAVDNHLFAGCIGLEYHALAVESAGAGGAIEEAVFIDDEARQWSAAVASCKAMNDAEGLGACRSYGQ